MNKIFNISINDYEKFLENSYKKINGIVDRHIENALLSEEFRLPKLTAFNAQAKSLFSVYNYFLEKSWEPKLIYYPSSVTIEQWNILLKGAPLMEGSTSEGACRTWVGDEQKELSSSEKLWNIAVICSTSEPPMMNISPDGKHGSQREEIIKVLSGIPHILSKERIPLEIINKVSPSEEMYFALQLYQFELGVQPVDGETWSIGKQNITKNKSVNSLFFDWCLCGRRVFSYRFESSFYGKLTGIRPSVNAKDLTRFE